MTKYLESRNKGIRDDDTPISLPNYRQMENRTANHCCPFCHYKLSRILDSSGINPNYYCSKCSIEYPDASDTKSKSHISTPAKSNDDNPLSSKMPEPTLEGKKTEIKGGLAELHKRGIKITSYNEGVR